MGEQWYYCGTCGFEYPGSEASSHKGHKTWATDTKTADTPEDEEIE